MMKQKILLLPVLLCCCIIQLPGQSINTDLLKGLKIRNIGPAGMSGRVTAIDVNWSNPDEIYVGTASGGLWKSEGGGISWTPIFDSVGVASIGAIAIDQRNPAVIWVGTGEGNPRNSQTSGGGVYKSLNGGRTWQYMGLKETRNIHRIIIHRDDPNVIYVGAIGDAWDNSRHRGVYRSKDGGKTWDKILYVNDQTGAADFDVDPNNPNKLFVNMWQYRRWPWFFKSGGPASGFYMTIDGGDTWTKLDHKNGLPEGEIGKVGIAISSNRPNIVYALVESKKNALYRSDNGGYDWVKVADKNIGDRPFYYADIAVDPQNENRVYNVYSNVSVSEDGGKNFKTLLGWDNIHGDHHYWWIHPQDGSYIINGNDGGLAISRDAGKSWRFIENLPVAQFYHIQVDDDIPYHVLGGMQDNGTWRGPGYIWQTGGIRNAQWDEIGFGDGFDVVVEHGNDRYGYVMWQGGNLSRVDFQTGAQEWAKPYHPDGIPLRFNWNAGIAQDPLHPEVIYYGSQFLHRSDDKGKTWTLISPDLTTNNPNKLKQKDSGGLTYDVTGAENHCTILAISPSPVKDGVIWVGTDDGNLQLTTDGGKNWTNLGPNLPMPDSSWIPQVNPSAYDAGTAYVVANNYRRGDWTPYLFRTRDYGKTWENLAKNKGVEGYCLSWVQDPIEPKLQFLGTEFGLYFSLDEGKSWTKWSKEYPVVSTIDMKIHPREHDLVIGTFGRAAWILDDIRPLRELARQGTTLLNKALEIYPAPDAYLAHYKEGAGTRFTGNAFYKADNRPYGAMITFSIAEVLKKAEAPDAPAPKVDTIEVQIKDQQGQLIRQLKVTAQKGINRFHWDLSTNGIRFPETPKPKDKKALPPAGHPVVPGIYTLEMTYGTTTASTLITVHADPRMQVNQAEIQAYYTAWEDFDRKIEKATLAMDNLRAAKARIKALQPLIEEQVESEESKKSIAEAGKKVGQQIDSLMNLVMPGEEVQGIFNDPDKLGSRIGQAYTYFAPSFEAPNPAFHLPSPTTGIIVADVAEAIQAFVEQVNQFITKEWKDYEVQIDQLGLDITKAIDVVK
ncbi:MAG TPA: hypothetical protein PKA00_06815 [Saprospiraceae bacterium]|nr:hypothetical protein [Saprospiraceae bacterium]HMQ82599.1 hypothetical protein [Saprospiraceae bacterium]